ncbi:hypothetical protein RhiirB3_461091 [Rhizophagus irregularis]|nr:hypothetical protein RhiirB3_461091 [Rhizophagus irregularis]
MWRIRRIGDLSRKDNLVILLDDGTHLCTCLETITKDGIKITFYPIWTLISRTHRFLQQ